jgi:molybdopterin biosynthesis enzyme
MRLVDGRLEQLGASLSHQLSRAAESNALALIPTGEGELPAGSVIDAVPLD